MTAAKPDCCLDVSGATAPRDGRWAAIDHHVPDFARGLISRIGRAEDLSAKLLLQLGELAQRLRSLERAGVVTSRANQSGRGRHYDLTTAGRELAQVCLELGVWGARWLELAPQDYDPGVVLWAWKKRLVRHRLPAQRVVVRFDITDRTKQRFWLLVARGRLELCMKDPGFEVDLQITTDSVTLTRVHSGRVSLREAQRSGAWRMEGVRSLIRAFPTWGGLSHYANVAPATTSLSA